MRKSSPTIVTLQIAVAVGATLPIVASALDVLHGLPGADAWDVNHERYLSGLLFAIGLAFWSTIPNIAEKTARFRLLTFVVVTGGLCRLLGVLLGDPPTTPVLIALAMELGVTPLLCFWQSRVSSRHENALTVAFSP